VKSHSKFEYRRAWINFGTSQPEWAEHLRAIPPEDFMTLRERQALASLPSELVIYRAQEPGREPGISWTLEKKVAIEFIDICKHSPRVLVERRVKKSEVYAVISGPEREILILPPKEIQC